MYLLVESESHWHQFTLVTVPGLVGPGRPCAGEQLCPCNSCCRDCNPILLCGVSTLDYTAPILAAPPWAPVRMLRAWRCPDTQVFARTQSLDYTVRSHPRPSITPRRPHCKPVRTFATLRPRRIAFKSENGNDNFQTTRPRTKTCSTPPTNPHIPCKFSNEPP